MSNDAEYIKCPYCNGIVKYGLIKCIYCESLLNSDFEQDSSLIVNCKISWLGGNYYGEILVDKPHGYGVFTSPDGTKYFGEWRGGKPHGKGKLKDKNGGIYEGDFEYGKKHDHGVYNHYDDERKEGDNNLDDNKDEAEKEKYREIVNEGLDNYEIAVSTYEKHPNQYFPEYIEDRIFDLFYSGGINSFLSNFCGSFNIENPDFKLNDICDKWNNVMKNKENKLIEFIDEELFNEFRNDLAIYSNSHTDNTINGLSLAKCFDEEIWMFFKPFEERAKKINNRIKKIVSLNDSREHKAIRDNFKSMSPFEFEDIVGALFIKMGYDVEVTPKSGDYGIDVIARSNNDVIAIQVKKYSKGNNVGNQAVQKLLGAMQLSSVKANKAILITSSDFTISALEQAKETPIELWNGNYISEILKKYQVDELNNISAEEIDRRAHLYEQITNRKFECPKCATTIEEGVNTCHACKTSLAWKNESHDIEINPISLGLTLGCFFWLIIILIAIIGIIIGLFSG